MKDGLWQVFIKKKSHFQERGFRSRNPVLMWNLRRKMGKKTIRVA
jgi:hypothetical protein